MRYLGLDLGTRSLGIAISDTTRTIASFYGTIWFDDENYSLALDKLAPIIEENRPTKIILGFPKNMNNSIGPRAEATLSFKDMLYEKFGILVVMQDERLSTKEASMYMIDADVSRKKRKKKIDSVAATIILQTYLDKERNEKDGK